MPRRDDLPDLSYEERIAGTGTLARGDVEIPIVRFVLTRRRYDSESEWEFRATAADGPRNRWHALLAPGDTPLTFRGTDDSENRVSIALLHFEWQRGRDFEARAQTVAIGEAQVEGKSDYQSISIELWPTALAEPEVLFPFRSWTGEIKVPRGSGEKRVRKVSVRLAGYQLRFSQHYTWNEATVAGQQSTVRIPVVTLSGQVPARQRVLAVDELCERLQGDLDDLTPVLSLLSRRHVRWARIVISTRGVQSDRPKDSTYSLIRGSRSSHRARKSEALVVPARMPGDWLQNVCTTYRSLQSKATVASAIIYLIVARDSDFVDAAVANAYTAFEASLNALSSAESAFSLSSGAFGALSSHIRKLVRDVAVARGMPDDARDAIIRKLPELRRRPLIDRAVQYLTSAGVEAGGIWPPGIGLADGLSAIIRRRNQFIHAGELGDVHQAAIDAQRLMIIVERMLVNALGVRPEWMSPIVTDAAYLATVPELADA